MRNHIAIAVCLVAGCGGGGGASSDAHHATDSGGDAEVVADGTPTRQACTSQFGSGLPNTPTFGRLDGYLVAIVPPSDMSSCNDDNSHVHLQIKMSGSIYDIAIDATDAATGTDDVHTTTLDQAMPGGVAWAEGWHDGLVDDYTSLGVHSTDMPLDTKAEIVSALTTDLATVNHISVYATTYGSDGAHLVHRDSDGHDGLVVTEPLSDPPHVRLFSFSDQTF